MALTPEKREALELARERIAYWRNDYICNALLDTARLNPRLHSAAMELRSYITEKLGGMRVVGQHRIAPTLEEWQVSNGLGERGREQLRRDRLAWIDWMLDEPKEA
jgi:hypothetical protein